MFQKLSGKQIMIENNLTNVVVAFEMLLEEIEAEVDFVNTVGARAFEKCDYNLVTEAQKHALKLTDFRDKIAALKREWNSLVKIEMDPEEDQNVRGQRQNLGRLQRGVCTPEEAYYIPILQVLCEMGGAGKAEEVINQVGKKMEGRLGKCDYEPLPSNHQVIRWQHRVHWARHSMVNEGLLRNDSPRGTWEISEKGREYLSSREKEGGSPNGQDH